MAVVSMKKMIDRRNKNAVERRGVLAEIVNRQYTRRYVVQTDSDADDEGVVRSYFFAPKLGDPFAGETSADALATCVSVEIEPTEVPRCWHLTATYDTSRLVDRFFDNPFNLPVDLQWGRTPYERVMQRDMLGVAVMNSSGEWFDPPQMVEDTRPTLTVVRNEAAFSPALALTYQDAVNTDIFAGAPPRCAKINSITGVRQVDVGVVYWKVTYEIQFRRESFDIFVLDQGFRDIDKKLFRDPIDFSPMANPTLLNGRGLRLTDSVHPGGVGAAVNANDNFVNLALGFVHGTFPPGPTAGTAHNYFDVKIDDEIMRVVGGYGTPIWTVIRGVWGTTPAAHAIGQPITLMPYYLRFRPYKELAFAPLNLPTL